MDTILLEYRLKSLDITRAQLLEAMGWSEGTRQARILRGENWRVEELHTLQELGLSFSDIVSIFFSSNGAKSEQNKREV